MNVVKHVYTACRNTRSFWTKKKEKFGRYSIVHPTNVSPMKSVPEHIVKPRYHITGEPGAPLDVPEIKTPEQISRMRDSCRLAANILKEVENTVKVGMTTDEIDILVHKLSISNKAYPSPLNYKKFPKSVCTSVNNVACHGIPDDRPLENGDIVNVDITVFYNGYHGDCSKTFLIGEVDEQGKELVAATETCLNDVIKICGPAMPLRCIGNHIQEQAYKLGFYVIPCFLGHGIGSYFHGPPDIYHFSNYEPGNMVEGMTFTIEPILTPGRIEIDILEDNWTAVTADDARTAQTEHTILITSNGCEILTLPS